jgi:plasmid stabilization system protein ParE
VRYSVRYKRAAAAEVENAISWYAPPEINQTSAFNQDLQLTESHLRTHPELYQRVEVDFRRAVLRRFPQSLFFLIEQDEIVVLAFMHQHQRPCTREELTKS